MKFLSLLVCLFLNTIAFSQVQNEPNIISAYDPHALFSPNFYATGESNTRAATGEPNKGYWQNRLKMLWKRNWKLMQKLNRQVRMKLIVL